MARTKWIEDCFRKALKDERERRELTQPELAELFKDNGLPMHWTTIAKIETGDRSVRIDEAARIADIFGTSVDALLGRNVGLENDLAYTLRAVQTTARHSQNQISGIMTALGERCSDVSALQFPGSDTLQSQLLATSEALLQASATLRNVLAFELPADAAVTVAQHLVTKEAREMVAEQAQRGPRPASGSDRSEHASARA